MGEARFSIDTNILIYSIDTDAGLKHDAACRLVDALADKNCILTLQALAELFHAVTRKNKMPVEIGADKESQPDATTRYLRHHPSSHQRPRRRVSSPHRGRQLGDRSPTESSRLDAKLD